MCQAISPTVLVSDVTDGIARRRTMENAHVDQPMASSRNITELGDLAVLLVREQAAETRLLSIAARPVAGHPEYQQVNRVDRAGAALKGGWTFLVNTSTRTVLRTVGDPDQLDFETAMARAMPA
jgi:hypothetical protein